MTTAARKRLQMMYHAVESIARRAREEAKQGEPGNFLMAYVNNVMDELAVGIDVLYGGKNCRYGVKVSEYVAGDRTVCLFDHKEGKDHFCYYWTSNVRPWHQQADEKGKNLAQIIHVYAGQRDLDGSGILRGNTIARLKLTQEEEVVLVNGRAPSVGDLFLPTSDIVSRVIQSLPIPPCRVERVMDYAAKNGIVPK